MKLRTRLITAAALAVALAGCRHSGDIVVDEGVGISAVRGACPAVGVPDYTGDVTLFRVPNGAPTADNMDVVAEMTDVRSQCTEGADKITSTVSFTVHATRTDTRGARQVTLPYFVTVLQSDSAVVSKRVGQVTINFADGQARASATGQGAAYIDAQAARLPDNVREKVMRKRKAGDSDAAIDPMDDPAVKAALKRARFEVLVGFQLSDGQITYNATR